MSTTQREACLQDISSLLGPPTDGENTSLAYCLAYLLLSCQGFYGTSSAIREHISQKIAAITCNQVQLVMTNLTTSLRIPIPEDRVAFPLAWENVTYGTLCVQPFSPHLSFAQPLATTCSWLLCTLEDASFVHRRRPHLTKEHLRGLTKLTQREVEVLKLMIKGDSINDIAESLSLSKRTVEKHQ